MAGNWLFSSRRWRNPDNMHDRAALNAGYDALAATFPAFSRSSRDLFLATISDICAGWSRSTRARDDSPCSPNWCSTPTDDDGLHGASCMRLEHGGADLQAHLRGALVESDVGERNLVQLPVPSCETAESENQLLVRRHLSPSRHIEPSSRPLEAPSFRPAHHLQCHSPHVPLPPVSAIADPGGIAHPSPIACSAS